MLSARGICNDKKKHSKHVRKLMKVTAESIPSAEFNRVVKKYFDVRECRKTSADEYVLRFDAGCLTLSAGAWRVLDGWEGKPPARKAVVCPNVCLWSWPPSCEKCVEFPNAEAMGDDFQNRVKKDFEKMIESERRKMPLFPEMLDDVLYKWTSRQTGRTYQLARHSFQRDMTTYRFFDELKKLQKEKHDMAR